jgi:hypothetical protein
MKQWMDVVGVVFVLAFAALISPAAVWASTNAETGDVSRDEVRRIVIQEAMRSRSVSPELALAVAKVESDFQAGAESSAGARGVMQLMPRTAAGEFGVVAADLWEPRLNVQLGIAFLDELIARYNGRIDFALSHYNGGSAVRKNGTTRIIPATRSYVKRVLRLYRHNKSNPGIKRLVRNEAKTNPSLKVELASQKVRYDREPAENWRRYLDLASQALGGGGGGRESRPSNPSSAEALIQLIEATKTRFRRHLGERSG